MRKAIFPGTFDPFTIGHYSVVERALTFMDEIVIGIGINENKNTYFPIEKREEMIRELYKDEPRIQVMSYDCLTIDFAQEVEARFIDTDSYHNFVHKGKCTFHYRVMSDGERVESTREYCFSHDAKSSSITRLSIIKFCRSMVSVR